MPGVLALDLATATGWAQWTPGRPVAYGTRHFAEGADLGVFLHAFDFWLSDRLTDSAVDHVAYEAPVLPKSSGIQSRLRLFGLVGQTELICFRREVTCRPVAIQSWRSHFLGVVPRIPGESRESRRRRLKRATIEQCQARGWSPRDDNAADALAILDYTAQRLGLPVDWPRTRLEAA